MSFDSSGNPSVFVSGLNGPGQLAFDASGNLYVAGAGGTIEKFDPSGNGSVFASVPSYAGGLALDNSGNLYAGTYNDTSRTGTIVRIDPTGNQSIFEPPPEQVEPYRPGNSAVGGGYLYVAYGEAGEILKYQLGVGTGYFVASSYDLAKYLPGTMFDSLALDTNGNLFVSCQNFSIHPNAGGILKIDPSGNVSVFASHLDGPAGLACDSSGNLYVANANSGTIEKFDPSGNGSVFASGLDGVGSIAVQIPEPSTWVTVAMSVAMLVASPRLRLRSP